MRAIDISGKVFGELTAIAAIGRHRRGILWLCDCSCGFQAVYRAAELRKGHTKSCGCLRIKAAAKASEAALLSNAPRGAKIIHGLSLTRLYKVFSGMMTRCHNKSDRAYVNYGARGIYVCDEWKKDRRAFFQWATTHGYAVGLSIDRIDVNGPYAPWNCRWTNSSVQANNRRTSKLVEFSGRIQTQSQWAAEMGISVSTFIGRHKKGWTIDEIRHGKGAA